LLQSASTVSSGAAQFASVSSASFFYLTAVDSTISSSVDSVSSSIQQFLPLSTHFLRLIQLSSSVDSVDSTISASVDSVDSTVSSSVDSFSSVDSTVSSSVDSVSSVYSTVSSSVD